VDQVAAAESKVPAPEKGNRNPPFCQEGPSERHHNEVMEPPLLSGTLTLLFSDIEGSTRLLSQLGVRYSEALSVQRSIMREEVRRCTGREIGTGGDSFFVVFTSTSDAVEAASAAQRRLASYGWPNDTAVRVRMGLHLGEPTRLEDGDRQTAKELNSLAIAYPNTDEHDKARDLFEEGISLAEHIGDKSRLASLFSNLGVLETDVGAPASAINLFERAVALDRELEDSWAEACDRVNLAAARLRAGQIDQARHELRKVSHDALAVNDTDLTISLIELLAMLRAESGDVQTSARLYGTSETMREQANLPRPPPDAAHLNRSLSKVRSTVREDVWSSYVDEGRLLSRDEAIAAGIRDSAVEPVRTGNS
jgi:tetratricopeptide (TPR) repeat protein